MELFLFIIMSIVVSLGIETINELSMFKVIANFGYKIDLSKVEKYLDKNTNLKSLLILFVPGINIISSVKRLKKYDKFKNDILYNLENMDLFIKMDEEEYERYLNNPKSINAFNVSLDYNTLNNTEFNKPKGFIRISNGIYRQDNNDGTFNEIKFKKEEDKIVVTSILGEIAKLDKQQQIIELNKIFYALYKKDVVIEEKSDITLQKELLIEHRKDLLDINNIQDKNIILK